MSNSTAANVNDMLSQNFVNYGSRYSLQQTGDDIQLLVDDKDPQGSKSVTNLRSVVAACLTFVALCAISTVVYISLNSSVSNILESDSDATVDNEITMSVLPNIVFILADDMGFNSLSPGVSPFLHHLQQNSISLNNYYAQETCTPGRASLLTGRYPLSIGAQFAEFNVESSGGLSLDETLVSEVLQNNGYKTYLFGKWNLGNSSPRYLPTARGFSYYLGFLDGFSTYWSKLVPDKTEYKDFMYSDPECFYMYDSSDSGLYSTYIYEDKAVAAINSHDFSDPMFMFMSFQAVHDPFADEEGGYASGIPDSYMSDDVFSYIMETYPGTMEQDYMKSLAVLDSSVSAIYDAIESNGAIENTYIIFASDNGGCPGGGGRNYPLRGTKGSLFEGGFRVESFVYSPMLKVMNYTSLFHVSDWFPTILDFAGITYTSPETYALDGVSHYDNFVTQNPNNTVREYMLYNYYYKSLSATAFPETPFAIRNSQYKLVATYSSASASSWYNATTEYPTNDDGISNYASCSQTQAITNGLFTYYLFDLVNDPHEKKNLYNSTIEIRDIQAELYAQLDTYLVDRHALIGDDDEDSNYVTWGENDNYAVPWQEPVDLSTLISSKANATAPANCGLYSLMSKSQESALPAFANSVNPKRGSE